MIFVSIPLGALAGVLVVLLRTSHDAAAVLVALLGVPGLWVLDRLAKRGRPSARSKGPGVR